MEKRAERFAIGLVIIGAGAFATYQGYEGERHFQAARERGVENYCREVIASIPQGPDIIVTEETWQSCREVYLKQTDQPDITNYVAMVGGGLTVVYGLAKLLSGLPFLPRGRGRFNLS